MLKGWGAALGVGALGVALSLVGTSGLALWFDESATIAASSRPVGRIIDLAGSVDAVHALYYLFMHVWIQLFGVSPLSVRVPSALAVGGTAVAMVRFGTSSLGLRFGVVAGALAVVLPRLVWSGSEARQFAATALLAVLLSWALWRAWNGGGWRGWAAVSALTALSAYVFLFSVFLVPALLLAALILRTKPRLTALALGMGLLPVLPLARAASSQTAQVGWISPPTKRGLFQDVLVTQWFEGQDKPLGWTPPAWAGGVGIALCCLTVVLVLCAVVRSRHRPEERRMLILGLAWAGVPTVLLVGVSVATMPLYVPRYLTFTSPAIALLAALGLRALPRERGIAVLTAASVCAGFLVPQLYMKAPDSRPGDFATVAAAVGDARAHWSGLIAFKNDQARAIQTAYPAPFVGSTDLLLTESAVSSNTLFGRSADRVAAESIAGERVVYVADHEGASGPVYSDLSAHCAAEDDPAGLGRIVLFDCRRQ
jgi:mannosyltransferase